MLELRILQPGDQSALEAFLLPQIASSMFLVSNSRAAGLRDRGERFQGTYAAGFRAGVMVGVAAHCWNGNAILQAPEHAAELYQAAAAASKRPLAGLLGPAAQVAAVLRAQGIERAGLQLDSVEGLYQLALVKLSVPSQLASGAVRVRAAQIADLSLLVRWRVLYCIEALNEPDTPELLERTLHTQRAAIDDGSLWLAEQDGVPVATTAFNASTAEAVQVGGVFTPAQLRNRGYARAVVAQSLIDARTRGAQTALLFTGDDNPAAQRAYLALGFERIGDYRISLLRA